MFYAGQKPLARFIEARRLGPGGRALRASHYAETWRLARRLRADATTPYDYVLAIDRYLQNGFTYSEIPAPTPPERAVLDAFLTETKSGYCQHFSGAMALLLRMGGVPARVVTGFAPGGHSDRKDAWIVRDTDAHSWVEAWFDEFGWVTLDPTPPATPARSQIAALTAAPEESSGPSGDAAGGSGPRTGGVRPDLLGRSRARAARARARAPTTAASPRGGSCRRSLRAGRRRLVAAPAALAQPSGRRPPRPARRRARGRAAAARPARDGGDDAAAGRGGAAADAAGRRLRARPARRPLLAGGDAPDAGAAPGAAQPRSPARRAVRADPRALVAPALALRAGRSANVNPAESGRRLAAWHADARRRFRPRRAHPARAEAASTPRGPRPTQPP